MLFNSYIFIFAFLPIIWVLYFGLNKKQYFKIATVSLFLASVVFYAYFNWYYSFILLGSIAFNYLLHLALIRFEGKRKLFLTTGIILNLLILCYFKYFNFFLSNMNRVFDTGFVMQYIILPLGISFFTFQQISFIVDTYRKETPLYPFWDYALFVAFFPQLVAGPIVLHKEMLPQFLDKERRKIDYSSSYEGFQYFIIGLSKKVLIADTFGRVSDWGYGNFIGLSNLSYAILIFSYTIQIYFDFSGYCDMAVGLGRMFNIKIPINFRSVYQSTSIREFWQRWHITLTRFFTNYVYIPLGGNRKGVLRTQVNVMIVFGLSGLWHGADWTFVFWGLVHGLAMVSYVIFEKIWLKIPVALKWLGTFVFVNLTWVFFRADNFWQALVIIRGLVFGKFGAAAMEMTELFGGNGVKLLLTRLEAPVVIYEVWANFSMVAWIVLVMLIVVKGKNVHDVIAEKRVGVGYVVALSGMFVLSVISLSDVAEFLYFNF